MDNSLVNAVSCVDEMMSRFHHVWMQSKDRFLRVPQDAPSEHNNVTF